MFTHHFTLKLGLASIFLALALPGCGSEAKFAGGGGPIAKALGDSPKSNPPSTDNQVPTPLSPSATDTPPPAPKPTTNSGASDALTWLWSCGGDLSSGAAPANTAKGGGTHYVAKPADGRLALNVNGNVCQPNSGKRDIVFVVDVSYSMGEPRTILNKVDPSDPLANNTCGRKMALDNIVATLPGNDVAEVGLLTFSDTVVNQSSGLMAPADLANNMFTPAIVCDAVKNGGTNYADGLNEAQVLLNAGRSDAVKEIYFISDGMPDMGKDGVAIANALKQANVTIAAVMLGNADDSIMKNQIASQINSVSLEARAANASDLSNTLAKLATNSIVGGSLKYRDVGAPTWQQTDMMATLTPDLKFKLPIDHIDVKDYPHGFEFSYDYYDQHGRHYADSGSILWSNGNNP